MSQFTARTLAERITNEARMMYEAKREPGAPDWSDLPLHEQKLWEASVLDRPDLSLVQLPTPLLASDGVFYSAEGRLYRRRRERHVAALTSRPQPKGRQ